MGRLRRILWPRSQVWRGGLLMGAVLVSLVAALVLVNLALTGTSRAKDIAAIKWML